MNRDLYERALELQERPRTRMIGCTLMQVLRMAVKHPSLSILDKQFKTPDSYFFPKIADIAIVASC